jgi:uroporphyrinogen decarboxylase
MYQYVHAYGGPHVLLHSCGGIRPIIGDLIDAGVEILNPVQTSSAGMGAGELKREFGKDITFWGGGCDTAAILPRGTIQEVKQCVRERMEIFSPGGGFVFNSIHNVTPEVPPENVLAMFEAVSEFHQAQAM